MTFLYYANLMNRPEESLRTVYNNVEDYVRFLRRVEAHLEAQAPILSWRLLGHRIRLLPPKGERRTDAWRRRLHAVLEVPGVEAVVLASGGNEAEPMEVLVSNETDVILLEKEIPPETLLRLRSSRDDILAVVGSGGSHEEAVWVQLEEPAGAAEISEKVFDSFLDDEVKSLEEIEPRERGGKVERFQQRDRRIEVLDRQPDRLALLLSRAPTRGLLRLRPSVNAIRRQIRALEELRNRPRTVNAPLVRLLDTYQSSQWPAFQEAEVDRWYVLIDDERKGVDEQRRFVTRALATPDLMLLEGPPGSGKTTVIVELILQLCARGKRVLLCASTHVAVDNVLEKLKHMRNGARHEVLAIRLGEDNRITSDLARDFSLKRFARTEREGLARSLRDLREPSESQGLMLDVLTGREGERRVEEMLLACAQVVCGTTIGICGALGDRDINPSFDVMILDEASKTPFAEFLVPAQFAKRWIIVGDRNQLSPYVEEDEIAAGIAAALHQQNQSEELSKTIGTACLDVFEARTGRPPSRGSRSDRPRTRRHAVVIASDDEHMRRFYEAQGRAHLSEHGDVVVLDEQASMHSEDISGARLLIGPTEEVRRVESLLPLDLLEVRAPSGVLETARAWMRAGREERVQPLWHKEVCWRLCRDFELRMTTTQGGSARRPWNYQEEIRGLLPVANAIGEVAAQRAEMVVRNVARAAFPSVLESLQAGVAIMGEKLRHTLSAGLQGQVLNERLVRLSWQQRMHPECAEFSHQHIYRAEALRTEDRMIKERTWGWTQYARRLAWVDVRTPRDLSLEENINENEARKLLDVLRVFMDWARRNPRNDRRPWEVAVLSFYLGQFRRLRDMLRREFRRPSAVHSFDREDKGHPHVGVRLCTVDRFQGHEADLVLLSVVKPWVTSFLASPNRLNVALTRSRYQTVIFGDRPRLAEARQPSLLRTLAEQTYAEIDIKRNR